MLSACETNVGIRRADIVEHVEQVLGAQAPAPRPALGRSGPATRLPRLFNAELVASY